MMEFDMLLKRFFLAPLAFLVVLAPHDVSLASNFDGSWNVRQVCPRAKDGASAYAWSYVARVKDGTLEANYAPKMGSIRLRGAIKPDGTSELTADGVTGPSEYSVGHVAQGSPVHYHIRAKFDATRGRGERVEQRQCSFTFTKAH